MIGSEMDNSGIESFPSLSPSHRGMTVRSLLTCKPILAAIGALAGIALAGVDLAAQDVTTTIDFAVAGAGSPPAEFHFERAGNGGLGRWMVVRGPTAAAGFAIEHVSTDQEEDRFPLAIYDQASLENAEISARFKIMEGRMLAAGIALGVRDPGDFYAVIASALEHRVDLFLFRAGKVTRIEGADAEVAAGRWHSLAVVVNDDHFAVSLDQKRLFTAFDRARMKDGKAALLTQENNVTRFDLFRIRRIE
jgi:hypothetical protein